MRRGTARGWRAMPFALLCCLATTSAAAAGVPSTAGMLPPGRYVMPFAHEGLVREYVLWVPSAADGSSPRPLVILLHGTFGNGTNIAQKTGFDLLSEEKGFYLVAPQAFGIQWNDGRDDSVSRPPVDDVGFLSGLIDFLAGVLLTVDPARIYLTGHSSGGFLAHKMAFLRSERIAAIGPVSGMLNPTVTGSLAEPVSVVHLHGVADDTVWWDGRDGTEESGAVAAAIVGTHVSVDESIARWLALDGCPAAPALTVLPDVDPDDGTTVWKKAWGSCANGTDVVLYGIEGGGHVWPGETGGGVTASSSGTSTRDISGAAVIWDFFEAHPKTP